MPIPGVSLVGFLEEQFAVAYLTQTCIPDLPDLRDAWIEARSRLRQACLLVRIPDIQPIPSEYEAHLQQVQVNPRFPDTVQGFPWQFALVEIAPILAYQLHVETTRLQNTTSTWEENVALLEILPVCLPTLIENIPFQLSTNQNSLVIRAQDPNLRIYLAGLIGSDNVRQFQLAGIGLGSSSPFVQVVHCNGRYYLRNGFHRMFELQRRGISHIPCILIDIPDFSAIGIGGGGIVFSQTLLESSSPPMCGHYQHAYPVQLRKTVRIINVSWSEHMLPEDL